MPMFVSRFAGLLCLALLTTVLPTASMHAARSTAAAHAPTLALPLGWATYLGGSGDVA